MSRMVEKVNLPIYGEMYVACVEDVSVESMQALQEPLKKLYEYEQEEENGTLVHLPCKLGDVPYWISDGDGNKNEKGLFIMEDEPITAIVIKSDGIYISTGKDTSNYKIGSRYALLTREYAEKKLKEIEHYTEYHVMIDQRE